MVFWPLSIFIQYFLSFRKEPAVLRMEGLLQVGGSKKHLGDCCWIWIGYVPPLTGFRLLRMVWDEDQAREKSVVTGFDFKCHVALPTEGILYEGLTGLAPDEAFAYLGVRASLPSRPPIWAGQKWSRWRRSHCLVAEKPHTHWQAAAKDVVTKTRLRQYLLCQMVPAMHMVTTSHFRDSAPLIPWTLSLIVCTQCGCRFSGLPGGCPLRATRIPQCTPRLTCTPCGAYDAGTGKAHRADRCAA